MILLSAGHFPGDRGACYAQRCEHDEAVKWVNRIARFVRFNERVSVVPTGPLTNKVRWINDLHRRTPIDICAEIHFNSDIFHVGRGSETLYCPGSERGRAAAETMQSRLKIVFEPDRRAKEGWHRADQPGHVDYPGDVDGDEKVDFILKATKPTAIIVEPEFIHNHELLDRWWKIGSEAIAEALVAFVRGEP